MSVQVIYGGQSYTLPQTGESNWGQQVTGFLVQVSIFAAQNPADNSNSVLSQRQVWQTVISNAPTKITVAPSGNSTNAGAEFYSDSQLTNGSSLLIGTDVAGGRDYIQSSSIGSGTVLPMDLQVGSTFVRITPAGRVLVNTTTDDGVHTLQVNGSISGTSFTGLALAGNLAGGNTGSVVYQTSSTTTGFLPIGANGSLLTSNGTTIAWTPAPSGLNVNYVRLANASPSANVGGMDHGGVMFVGSNIVTIPPGPFQFTAGMVGQQIQVSGAFGGAYTTIATYISPTQVTTAINATSTTTLATVIVWNVGQQDTTVVNNWLAAAGGGQSQCYSPAGVYAVDWASINQVPAGVQGMFGDGLNNTFFISRTHANTVHSGGFLWEVPSNATIGGIGKGFQVLGPGLYASQQFVCSGITIANGVATVAVSNGNTAVVGAIMKITGALLTASVYNDTYWQVTSSSSTQYVGLPIYNDRNPVLGNVTSVTVDGSGNLTWLDSNAFRKAGYSAGFSGCTATFLNGNNYIITAVNFATPGNPASGVVGYTAANTGLSTYATTADSGICRYLQDATATDTFVSFPRWDGFDLMCNQFPGGSNIATHLHISDIFVGGFGGAGIRIQTPNFGSSETLTCNSNCEGLAMESFHATSGFFSNPSCYTIGGGCEFESNTFFALYLRNAGGFAITMPGIGGSGHGVYMYNCSGTTMNGGDLEVMTQYAAFPLGFPGNNITLRGSTGCRVNPSYISFNNQASMVGVAMVNSCVSCVYERGRHFLAGGLVQPTNEVLIDSSCIGCEIIEPELVGQNVTHWSVSGASNNIKLKNINYNSTATNLATWVAATNSGSITVGAAQSPHVIFQNAFNAQLWNVGYNSQSAIVGFFDDITATWGLQIADTTHVVTIPSTIASSSQNTGALVVKGGIGVTGNINAAGLPSFTNAGGSALLKLTGTAGAFTDYLSSIDSQQWNVGYNQTNGAFDIFDATAGLNRLMIANTTGIVTITSSLVVNSAVTISAASNPQIRFTDTADSYAWNIGHNTVNNILNVFDATANLSRLTIADITGVINIPTVIASTSATTGSLTIAGGLGVAGAINSGTTITAGTGLTVTTGNATVSSGNAVVSGTISSGGHLVPTVNITPTFTTAGTPGTIGSSSLAVFPGGYIRAAGISTSIISGGATGLISFPTAFPTNCWNVQVTIFDAGVNAFATGAVVSFDKNGFTWYNNTGGGTPYVMWSAEGN